MTKKTDNQTENGEIQGEILPPKVAQEIAKEFGESGIKKVEGVLVASQTMSGPLPVSSEFAAYDEVLPGAAREILNMAKAEQAHRHKNDTKDINGSIVHQFLALFLGASLLAGCIFGAVYLAVNKHTTIAGLLLGVAVLGVITSIIRSRPVFSGRVVEPNESSQDKTS